MISSNYMEKPTRNYARIELILAIVFAVLAAGAVAWWMFSLGAQKEAISVIVAANDLTAPKIIKANDITIRQIPRELAPLNTLTDPAKLVGQVLTRTKAAREIFTTTDLIYQRDPSSEATLVPAGRVGFVLSGSWLSGPVPKIKKNDFITLYGALPPSGQGDQGDLGVLVRQAQVLSVAYDKDGFPEVLLLSLTEANAERILQAHTWQYQMVVVVESLQNAPAASATSTKKN